MCREKMKTRLLNLSAQFMHSGNLGARKVRKSHKFVVITNEGVLFRSLIAVYSDNHTERNTFPLTPCVRDLLEKVTGF